jgi:hypothetical protein
MQAPEAALFRFRPKYRVLLRLELPARPNLGIIASSLDAREKQ